MITLLFAAVLGGLVALTAALWLDGGLLLAVSLAPVGASLGVLVVALLLGSRGER